MSKKKDESPTPSLFEQLYEIILPGNTTEARIDETPEAWRQALKQAYGHILPANECSPGLARSISAVHGLSCALRALRKVHPDHFQAVGLYDACDLVERLVTGRHHPLLEFWAKQPKSPARLPIENEALLFLSALAERLSGATDPSTNRPYGIGRARQIISASISKWAPDITPQLLKKGFDASVEAHARSIRAEWKATDKNGSKHAASQIARQYMKAERDTAMAFLDAAFARVDDNFAKFGSSRIRVAQEIAIAIVRTTRPVTSGVVIPKPVLI